MPTKRELEIKLALALLTYQLAEELDKKEGYHDIAESWRDIARQHEKFVKNYSKEKRYSIRITVNL